MTSRSTQAVASRFGRPAKPFASEPTRHVPDLDLLFIEDHAIGPVEGL